MLLNAASYSFYNKINSANCLRRIRFAASTNTIDCERNRGHRETAASSSSLAEHVVCFLSRYRTVESEDKFQ
jgi:hypothetical protein